MEYFYSVSKFKKPTAKFELDERHHDVLGKH